MPQLKTPVVMIIFNRYDKAKRVFEEVKKAQPEQLFIIADGPRKHRVDEESLCNQARSIVQEVDWPCTVHRIFSDCNLGCRNRISSGLTEVFNQVERAIILEDDCIPSQSFFPFCDQLLEKYADDERIMMISGDNKTFAKQPVAESYYFSRQVQIWGWATWRRAWKHFDINLSNWPQMYHEKRLNAFFSNPAHRYYWTSLFNYIHRKKPDTWAGPWVYSVWSQSGLSIVPQKNLISNVGFEKDATHTTEKSIFDKMPHYELDFPLVHPSFVMPNYQMDDQEMKMRIKDAKRLPYPLNKFASFCKRIFSEGKLSPL